VLGAEEHAARVHRHHAVPVRHRALLDRHAGDHDPRVVDQDVELAVAARRRLDGARPVGFVRHVEVHVHGVAAGRADRLLDLLALGVADVAEDDLRALLGEPPRFHGPLAASPAADQRHLAVELAHVILPGWAHVVGPRRRVP
jgi:hypothetical protein